MGLSRGVSTLVALVIALAISMSIAGAMYVYAKHMVFARHYRPSVLIKCFDLGSSWICLVKASTRVPFRLTIVEYGGHNVSREIGCSSCVELVKLSSRPLAALVSVGSSVERVPIYMGVVRWVS